MSTNEKISEFEERKIKLEQIRSSGVNPYTSKNNRNIKVSSVLVDFDNLKKEKKSLILSGRLKSKRTHGNLTFSNLEDDSGNIQIALSKKELVTRLTRIL